MVSAGLEMVMDILLGGNRNSVAGGRMEMPAFQGEKNPLINGGAHAVQDLLINNVASFVDRDLNDDIPLLAQFPRIDLGIRSAKRQGGTNIVTR